MTTTAHYHLTDLFQHHSKSVELGDDALPVDASGTYDVIELEDDQSVGEVAVQMTDVRRHAHRVHPVSIHYKHELNRVVRDLQSLRIIELSKIHQRVELQQNLANSFQVIGFTKNSFQGQRWTSDVTKI